MKHSGPLWTPHRRPLRRSAATRFARPGLVIALALIGCGPGPRDGDADGVDAGPGSGGGSGAPRQCTKLDLVFVIDNSGSMAEEQNNLASSFPEFANLLATDTTADGTPLDFRIALTTTARTSDFSIVIPGFGTMPQHHTGDDGRFRNNCGSTARWLDKGDPSLASKLSCRANVGTNGPSVEMPMLMAKYALVDRANDGTQPGFLRDDALLAVVMLTDEDDQSTTLDNFTIAPGDDVPLDWNPADQIQFLDTLKGNRSRWAAGVIAGNGACSSAFGMAADAERLKQFVNLAGNQGVFTSICDGNLATNLQAVIAKIQTACGEIIL